MRREDGGVLANRARVVVLRQPQFSQLAVELLVVGIDIVDAIQGCRGLIRASQLLLKRCQLLERVRIVPAALFVIGQDRGGFLFVSLGLVRLGEKLVGVGIIHVVGIEVADPLAIL